MTEFAKISVNKVQIISRQHCYVLKAAIQLFDYVVVNEIGLLPKPVSAGVDVLFLFSTIASLDENTLIKECVPE